MCQPLSGSSTPSDITHSLTFYNILPANSTWSVTLRLIHYCCLQSGDTQESRKKTSVQRGGVGIKINLNTDRLFTTYFKKKPRSKPAWLLHFVTIFLKHAPKKRVKTGEGTVRRVLVSCSITCKLGPAPEHPTYSAFAPAFISLFTRWQSRYPPIPSLPSSHTLPVSPYPFTPTPPRETVPKATWPMLSSICGLRVAQGLAPCRPAGSLVRWSKDWCGTTGSCCCTPASYYGHDAHQLPSQRPC